MWLELHDSVRDHPKLIKASRDLGIPKAHLLGHLSSLWTWTLRMAPDGNLSSFSGEDIEIGAEWEGTPGKLIDVLIRRGWLDQIDSGFVIHDWEEYSRKLKAAEWKRRERQRKYADSPGGCVYFAAIGDNEIKIGYSTNIKRRMDEHKADYLQMPTPIALLRGSAQMEKLIHEKFSGLRDGRWEHFRRTDELMKWIEENAMLVDESWQPIVGQAGSDDLAKK